MILSRIGQIVGLNDRPWAVFAYLIKSYFLSLRGEDRESKEFSDKALALDPAASVQNLEVMTKVKANFDVINEKNRKPIIVYDCQKKEYITFADG
jgi:hypothetical protein